MRPPLFATTASAWRPTGGDGEPRRGELRPRGAAVGRLEHRRSALRRRSRPAPAGAARARSAATSDAPLTPAAGIERREQRRAARPAPRRPTGIRLCRRRTAPSSTSCRRRWCGTHRAPGPACDRRSRRRRTIVRIRGADDDRADVVRVGAGRRSSTTPAVGRLVHAVAARLFAGAGVDDSADSTARSRARRSTPCRSDRKSAPTSGRRSCSSRRRRPACRSSRCSGPRVDGARRDAAGAERADQPPTQRGERRRNGIRASPAHQGSAARTGGTVPGRGRRGPRGSS